MEKGWGDKQGLSVQHGDLYTKAPRRKKKKKKL